MPNEEPLEVVVQKVRERIGSYSSQSIGEQNTKAGLIGPVLRALGWDTEDLREVHLEYRPRSSDKPVDYALLLNGQPRLFVEAKALGQNLDDRRWANQIMGYAAVAGVRWVVLTDGDEYRIYNAHASVPVEEKLFRKVRLRDEDGRAAEDTLALLSKESVAELEALWQESFVDRQVQAALDGLFEPEADDGLVRLLRRRLPEISPKDVRSSLARLRSYLIEPSAATRLTTTTAVERVVGAATKGPHTYGQGTPWGEVTLGDIVSAGLLSPPVDLFRQYKGHQLRARIESDGRVSFDGQIYGSLSVAGMMARRSIIGADKRAPTNGWTFWKYDADGQLREMDGLRKQLWEERANRA